MSSGSPRISVIVPCVNGLKSLLPTLQAIEGQEARDRAEVLVVDRTGEATRRAVHERFPGVVVIPANRHSSIPELRSLGLARARGEVVAFLEDHCLVPPGWLARIDELHRRLPHSAIAGGVANGATERIVDWAHYLCEYAPVAPPLAEGETANLAGNSASYKRHALEEVASLVGTRWESFFHQRLLQRGHRFWCAPELTVVHRISFRLGELLGQRFHYSRSFAAMRTAEARWPRRCLWVLASLGLPPVILWRLLRTVVPKGRYAGPLLRSLPVLSLLAAVGGAGELVGYALGAGRSLERVR